MIQVITVEREYGSQGAEYAHHLANRLGWKLIDSCLIEDVAQKAGVAPTLVKRCDERIDPWFYRFGKAFWLGSLEQLPEHPKVFDSGQMTEFVKSYVQEQAAKGSCVVLGRGAACVLSRSPGAYHVFVYASMPRKIRWFEEKFPDHAKAAERLMMNSCMGMNAMVAATIEAAGLHSMVATTEHEDQAAVS